MKIKCLVLLALFKPTSAAFAIDIAAAAVPGPRGRPAPLLAIVVPVPVVGDVVVETVASGAGIVCVDGAGELCDAGDTGIVFDLGRCT